MGWLRTRTLRGAIISLLLLLVLFIADALCYQVALPLEIDVQGGLTTLHVGSETLLLGHIGIPAVLQFAAYDPVVHEYQLDGTDSTNNLTLDPNYLDQIASSPYYRFQAWMRDLEGTSRWRDLREWDDSHLLREIAWPSNGASVSLPPAASLRLGVLLQRPETPMTLNLIMQDKTTLHITLDRNNRQITVTRDVPGQGNNLPVASTYFPVDPAPFLAMVIDTLIRTLLWAVLVMLAVLVAEVGIILIMGKIWIRLPKQAAHLWTVGAQEGVKWSSLCSRLAKSSNTLAVVSNSWRRLTHSIHALALLVLGVSLIFVAWISSVQYHAEPHIYDASAYLFAAKTYALGRLWAPLPPAADLFPGPFMVQFDNRWFSQYAPGTSLTLVPGIWLGVPWLVEPILGTLALLGIGLIAARLYDRRVATLAVILGTLSPFYSYLAASYLSHAIALFYLVWGLWALVRFAQGGAGWNLLFSAAFFGMAGLTRDLVAVLFVVIVLLGVLVLSWRRLRQDWRRWLLPGAGFAAIALVFVGISLGFNALVTGSPWLTPRFLFSPGDHWGFGPNVGFYGQHTLAAGMVNLDELLTILAIDLFGWPFYFTLAFLAIPFLARRAIGADWLMLAIAVIMTGAFVGYFYHGIYLGPRYLFETLPALLILTARGILVLATAGLNSARTVGKWLGAKFAVSMRQASVSIATVALVTGLVACNLLYFMPRQIELHKDYTGLPAGSSIDLTAVYHPPVHDAIVVTGDYTIYQFVLFPLNDPLLHDDVIYALAENDAQYAELRAAFPGRVLYRLDVSSDGSVHYVALPGK